MNHHQVFVDIILSHHEYCFIDLFITVDIQSNVRVHNSENENEIQNTFGLSHDCEQGVFTRFCNLYIVLLIVAYKLN